jgi:DNA-directed RNA polymerase specialized sigma24 family protein
MGSVWGGLRQQIYLGDEAFVERMQKRMGIKGDAVAIPKAQRRAPAPSLAAIARRHRDRNEAIVAAYATGAFSYREIGEHFGLHLATVGRIIRDRLE